MAGFCWRSSVPGATRLDIAFDGANGWVSNLLAGTTQPRARDGLDPGTFPVGDGPNAILFDGANVRVANNASNTVNKL